ncbi:MAG: hypothetical protein U1E76_25200 [Planctomycetota bacterium]
MQASTWLLGLTLLQGDDQPPGLQERRHVLALFDGHRRNYYREDIIQELLETPLNYLGMVVDRHDVRSGPPDEAHVENARAVLTYFTDVREAAPPWLCDWLASEVPQHGLRVVHVGDLDPLLKPHGNDEDASFVTAWLAQLGLEYDGNFVPGPIGVDVQFRDQSECAFEADPRAHAAHFGPRSVSAHNRVWVTTTTPLLPGDRRTPVVTGPWGGIALDPFFMRKGTAAEDRRWFVDPIAFFREALGLAGMPTPQPAMLNGRRMFFAYVDGDGFESLSTVRPGATAAEVLRDCVLTKYQLPFTVSVIIRSLTDDYLAPQVTPGMRIAHDILNLHNVEAGSHGVLHPLDWQLTPSSSVRMSEVVAYPEMKNYTYSPVNEVRESVRFINERLLEPGRTCAIMQWTGMANPPLAAVREAARLGCSNLNGGEFRFDVLIRSMGYVTPWARTLPGAIQVYAPAANENSFQGFFDAVPSAFRHIDATIANTGAPRVLKPAGIYIHYYSAERPARLQSVQELIDRWALHEPTAPVFASRYARAVCSAFTAEVERCQDGFLLRRFGDCRTVRLDGEVRAVDWRRSRGLLGSCQKDGALYVHLAASDADLFLTGEPVLQPHVEECNHELFDATLAPGRIRVTSRALCRREIRFAGFAAGARVRLTIDGEASLVNAGADGRVTVSLGAGESTVELSSL